MSNEAFARVKIDALLAAQGWDTLDTNAVRFDVQLPDGTRADYVLCDRHGRSLAVIEAKRYSVNPGDAAAQAKAYTAFSDGDVLFAKITPCMENGKAALASGLAGGRGFGSTEFHVLRARGSVLPGWIYCFVRRESFRREARRNFRGTAGQQRVPTSLLRETLIPVPPLEEQRRIVDLVACAEGIVRLRREAQQKAAELIPAIFIDMFGEPPLLGRRSGASLLERRPWPGSRHDCFGVIG